MKKLRLHLCLKNIRNLNEELQEQFAINIIHTEDTLE